MTKRNALRAVLFDLDDTLVEEAATAEEALRATACGLPDPEALARATRRRARELWHAHPHHDWAARVGVSSWEALWARFEGDTSELREFRAWAPHYRRESWARGLADLRLAGDELAAELAERFPLERRARQRVFPETHQVLRELRRRLRVGLVTNGLSCLQREKLRLSGLEEDFDFVAVSGDVGLGKPEQRVFHHALQGLGVTAAEALMVGNRASKDVAGARRAGIRAVWICRDPREPDPEPRPDWRIADLRQLLSLLG